VSASDLTGCKKCLQKLTHRFAYLLVLAHKALEYLVRESSLVEQTKFGVEILHFWSRFQQLHEAPKVVEIQEPTVLRVGLLCRSSAISPDCKRGENRSTCLETVKQVVARRVDVEPFAELLDVFEVQFLVCLLVCSLPVLLCPDGLAEVEVTQPTHEGLTYSEQLAQGRIPNLKYGDGGGNNVPYFPATIEGVYNSKPPILQLLGYLEQLSVMSGIGSDPQLLDILNGYCE
jgi:hypothetical protein